jgi:serine/threonine-protein kinase
MLLGGGAFGSVCRATFAGRNVAVKRFNLQPIAGQEPWFHYQSIARELWTLNVLRNLPFVVRLVGVVHDLDGAAAAAASPSPGKEHLWLVLEYVAGQRLSQVQAPVDRVGWGFGLVRLLAKQFVEVHELGVAHLDLKPDNIMVTPDGEIHLIDFGMSLLTVHVGGATLPTGAAVGGTQGYMPPEQVFGIWLFLLALIF